MLSRKMWVRYQSFENLPPDWDSAADDWLSDGERHECERFRDEARCANGRPAGLPPSSC